MQRSGNTTSAQVQVILLLFLGSCVCVWARQQQQIDNFDKMRLFYQQNPAGYYKRPSSYSYDFGLGKRSFEENSYEEQLSPMDSHLDKEGVIYPYAPGKRTRAYGFGLGKRLLENDWKRGAAPTFRQERRSKIYSFGLGKRQSHDAMEDYDASSPSGIVERRASQRQFAFGLGKRDVNAKET